MHRPRRAKKLKLLLNFYRGTVAINWLLSLFCAVLLGFFYGAWLTHFFFLSLVFGFLLSHTVRELEFSSRDVYYLYHNFGLSKPVLVASSFAFNMIIALTLTAGYRIWKTL